MPVQIRIAINENVIETFHIGRLTKNGMNVDSVNEYAVVNQVNEPTNAEWDAAPRFEHRYGDSVTTLALEAVNRYQQYINEQVETGDPTPNVIPLPSVIAVAKSHVARLSEGRKCGYKSSRMVSPCKLSYGHNSPHHS